jgi:hypothetical protein
MSACNAEKLVSSSACGASETAADTRGNSVHETLRKKRRVRFKERSPVIGE